MNQKIEKKYSLSFSISYDLHKQLCDVAWKNNVSKSKIVQEAVYKFLNEKGNTNAPNTNNQLFP